MSREIKLINDGEGNVVKSYSADKAHILEFKETSHRYKLDGKPCVGTTTFLKASYPTSMGLISWMKSQTAEALFQALTVPGEDGYYPREGFWPVTEETKTNVIKEAKQADRATAQEAADIGTVLHSYSELHSLGKIDEADALFEKIRGTEKYSVISECINKYHAWAKKDAGKLIAAESLIASPIFQFCGKIDRLDKVGKCYILRDYKTSKAIFTEQKIQLAMYRQAIKEWLNINVEGIEIVRFGKTDGAFETELVDDPKVLSDLTEQGLRCKATYDFMKLYEGK